VIHSIWFIQRRFPSKAGSIIAVLTLLAVSGLVVGAGLLLMR
jgi:hypothetical protein